jgi:tRNA-dihydrouridine synthase B
MTDKNHINELSSSFWQELDLPIVGLSPMDGVTDHPFRIIQKKYGSPSVIYTEFTSVEGVCHGAEKLLTDFLFDEPQRPIVAQIYGTTPSYFRQTATVLCELGFDGIDINMGCPAKNVIHNGAGAALIKNPKLAIEIIQETKAGVDDYFSGKRAKDCSDISQQIARSVESRHLSLPKKYRDRHLNQNNQKIPISVKTRIGYDKKVLAWWLPTLLEQNLDAVAVHGRTLKQQYGGEADWEEIAKGVSFCKNTQTMYLGNGDVKNYEEAIKKCQQFQVDGVLIGRASLGNPFVFKPESVLSTLSVEKPSLYQIALEHTRMFENSFKKSPNYSFLPMRKHLGWYIKAIPLASEIRQKIYQTNSSLEVESLFSEYQLI